MCSRNALAFSLADFCGGATPTPHPAGFAPGPPPVVFVLNAPAVSHADIRAGATPTPPPGGLRSRTPIEGLGTRRVPSVCPSCRAWSLGHSRAIRRSRLLVGWRVRGASVGVGSGVWLLPGSAFARLLPGGLWSTRSTRLASCGRDASVQVRSVWPPETCTASMRRSRDSVSQVRVLVSGSSAMPIVMSWAVAVSDSASVVLSSVRRPPPGSRRMRSPPAEASALCPTAHSERLDVVLTVYGSD